MVLCLIDVILWAIFIWWVSGKTSTLFIMIFGGIGFLSFVQAYLYLIVNDYNYTQNVEKLNKMIDKHNKEIEEMEVRKADIQ